MRVLLYAAAWVVFCWGVIAAIVTVASIPQELEDRAACEQRGGVYIEKGCYDIKAK